MERTKTTDNTASEKIRWKKLGGGSLRLLIDGKRRIIKPNEKFMATPDEVPQAFRDVVVPLDTIPGTPPTPVITMGVQTVYVAKPRGKSGDWDVVDPNGKVLNEKALKKEIAVKLIEDLAK